MNNLLKILKTPFIPNMNLIIGHKYPINDNGG